MNEAQLPPGQELLPEPFLREHGPVPDIRFWSEAEQKWAPTFATAEDLKTEDCLSYRYCAPIGSIAAATTPLPEGKCDCGFGTKQTTPYHTKACNIYLRYRHILPHELAALPEKPRELMWACQHWDGVDEEDWEPMSDGAWLQMFVEKHRSIGDFAYCIPVPAQGQRDKNVSMADLRSPVAPSGGEEEAFRLADELNTPVINRELELLAVVQKGAEIVLLRQKLKDCIAKEKELRAEARLYLGPSECKDIEDDSRDWRKRMRRSQVETHAAAQQIQDAEKELPNLCAAALEKETPRVYLQKSDATSAPIRLTGEANEQSHGISTESTPPTPPPAEAPTPGHEQWHALPVTMASRSLSYQGKVLGTFGNETAMRLAATHNDEVAALRRELSAMRQERELWESKFQELSRWQNPDDKALPEDEAIAKAHPMETGDHKTYAAAMRMVGAKYSKSALVNLVNWLLSRVK